MVVCVHTPLPPRWGVTGNVWIRKGSYNTPMITAPPDRGTQLRRVSTTTSRVVINSGPQLDLSVGATSIRAPPLRSIPVRGPATGTRANSRNRRGNVCVRDHRIPPRVLPGSRIMQMESSLPGVVDYCGTHDATPTGVRRAKQWSDDVEIAYRFQVAGWRDIREFLCAHPNDAFDIWPSGWPKKLPLKDPQSKIQADRAWYYFSQARECEHKHVHKVKLYQYK